MKQSNRQTHINAIQNSFNVISVIQEFNSKLKNNTNIQKKTSQNEKQKKTTNNTQKIKSSHDMIVQKIVKTSKDNNESAIQALINKTGISKNFDLQSSTLGKSMLNLSISMLKNRNDSRDKSKSSLKFSETKTNINFSKVCFNFEREKEESHEEEQKIFQTNTQIQSNKNETKNIFGIAKNSKKKTQANEKKKNYYEKLNNEIDDYEEPSPFLTQEKVEQNVDLTLHNKISGITMKSNLFTSPEKSNNVNAQTDDQDDIFKTNSKILKTEDQDRIFKDNSVIFSSEILKQEDISNSIRNDNFLFDNTNLTEIKKKVEIKDPKKLVIQRAINIYLESTFKKIPSFFNQKDIDLKNVFRSTYAETELLNDINDKSISIDSNYIEDVDEFTDFKINKNIQKVYKIRNNNEKSLEKIKFNQSFNNDNSNLKNNLNYDDENKNQDELQDINSVLRKYLFKGDQSADQNKEIDGSNIIEKDLNMISQQKNNLKSIKKKYLGEIENLQKELKFVDEAQLSLIDRMRKRKEIEIEELIQSFENSKSQNNSYLNNSLSMDKNVSRTDSIISTKDKFKKLKETLVKKENKYKNLIKNLYEHLKIDSKNQNNFDLDDSLKRDINEIISDNDDEINLFGSISSVEILTGRKNFGYTDKDLTQVLPNNQKNKKDKSEDSMIEELINFKSEDLINYKFEIPHQYILGKNVKLISEKVREEGKIIKCYENNIIEVISRNKTLSRVFPDGYSITYYSNKDIKQIFPDGTMIYFYSKNKSLEFNDPNKGYIAYKFKNNQLEKHFNDGRKYIKFSDGTYKIFRPNGEELNELSDKKLQRKDKFGNITYKDMVLI